MILQALCEYYTRKQSGSEHALAPFGFEVRGIPFVIVIDRNGHFVQFEDTRNSEGEKPVARRFMVAKGIKKTSGIAANLLWDPANYVLGIDNKGNPERAKQQKLLFVAQIKTMLRDVITDAGVAAVLLFYEFHDQPLATDPLWSKITEINPVMTFRLQDDVDHIVFNRPAVLTHYQSMINNQRSNQAFCLVYGKKLPIATLHPSIKGVWGTLSSGASLVSFNKNAFSSFGKEQGANAPVSENAAFEYTTALNYLLQSDNPGRIQIGETSVVCWMDKAHPMETWLPLILGDTPRDNPDLNIQAVKSIYASLHNGAFVGSDGNNHCYVLGLSPNAARITIRFWQVGTVAEFTKRLGQWLDDLAVINARDFPGRAPLKPLLRSIALLDKDENISSLLGGEVIRSLFSDAPLPSTLLTTVLTRLKAKSGKGESNLVNDYRAALIKAWLNRKFRTKKLKEVTVSLNPEETRIGYLLGRLFAILEKLQTDTTPGLNATIRDRYYSSASSTPKVVFGTLMRLHANHLEKLDNHAHREKVQHRIQVIIDVIPEFPAHLDLEQQGLFAIGYYHQRQDFFRKKESSLGDA